MGLAVASLWSLLVPLCAVLSAAALVVLPLRHTRVSAVQPSTGAFAERFADDTLTVLIDGLAWAEGPTYIAAGVRVGANDTGQEGPRVLVSDVKSNRIHAYDFASRTSSIFLEPSGCFPDSGVNCSELIEPGSNGLAYHKDLEGVILCQHGARQVAILRHGEITPLVTHFNGKRFNSPNDVVVTAAGGIYFTDPPYGLNKKEKDPRRELTHNSVYYVSPARLQAAASTGVPAEPVCLVGMEDALRPNGLALSPSGKSLYVSNSDRPPKRRWLKCTLPQDLEDANGVRCTTFATPNPPSRRGMPGSTDGLKVDADGNVWATGPGGVYVFSALGKPLGAVLTRVRTGNVLLTPDGLVVAADSRLLFLPWKK